MSMPLLGSRASAGTKTTLPIARPSSSATSTAPRIASGTGRCSVSSRLQQSSAPNTQNAPCERLITPVIRKTSAKPKATRANRLPCRSPPMTIWIAAWVAGLTRHPPSLQRHASGRAQHDPGVLGGLPPRHHRIAIVETPLRRRREVEEAVDPGCVLELREVIADLRRGRVCAEVAQGLCDQ